MTETKGTVMLTAKDVAAALDDMAMLLEMTGANPFKVRAYANASRIVQTNDLPFDQFVAEARAGRLKGIGKGLVQDLDELVSTGDLAERHALRATFPETLFDLLRVPGVGPKKVKALYDQLGIASLGELELACHENHLVQLPGFGEKTQDKILAGIGRLRSFADRFRYPTARHAAAEILAHLENSGLATRVVVAGSLRRCRETVKDVDVLTVSDQPEALMKAFVALPDVREVTGHGTTKSSLVLASSGMAVDLRVVREDQFAAALLHFTGSKEHNTLLRGLAKKRGLKLSEYGLFDADQPLPLDSEPAIYAALGLAFVPPELREGLDEIDLAAADALPKLIEPDDTKGILHAHTSYSDGALTLRELVEAVRARGYAYLGVTDHSQTAAYAGGLKPDDIRRQHDQIDRLNEELAPFRIFKGIESDILRDGRLDYDGNVLASFDFVIASVHGQFNLDEDAMTQRIVAAMRNPFTTFVGHLTGRLLLSRDAYAVNVPAVLDAAAEYDVGLELNANPHRLDLDWRHHRRAKELGIKIPICPDAHSQAGLDDVAIGVGIARKGGLTAADVPTCYDVDRIAAWFARRKA